MSTHSSKDKNRQVKTTINNASKNKVKKNNKQSKGCACETPLAEVLFFPGNGARKLLLVAARC
jgi:hypothetical protein